MSNKTKFVYFGSSRFSQFVLDELEREGFKPVKNITSAREEIDLEELKQLNADVFVVASFGKILPLEVVNMTKGGTINVHPSLLPVLRGPAPIQGVILGLGKPGVTIIKMDEKMDHGPILAQEEVDIQPFPDHYAIVEEKLGRAGGKLLAKIMLNTKGLNETPQEHDRATYIKMIKKEDGLLDSRAGAEESLRKVLAFSTWPGAYIFFKKKNGEEIRVVVKNGKIIDGKFIPTRVIPAGRKEMNWEDFLRGNA